MRTLFRFRLLVLLVIAVVLRLTIFAEPAAASPHTQVQMAGTLATGVLSMLDWAKRLDPDGQTANIVELLNQTNEILTDAVFMQGNLPTGHRTTVRTGLPAVYWRLLNQGVTPSKSTTAQVDEQCGMLEAWSEVDEELVKLNGGGPGFRLSEARAYIEAMNQEVAQTLFYGSALSSEEFIGLSARYSSSSAANGDNILKGGGSGSDNTSIWLIAWSPETVAMLFPKGSMAGLIHEDYGVETVEATAGMGGTRMRAYRERYQWKTGLMLKDWRYAVRICNIDISDLATTNAADLIGLMGDAEEIIPSSLGRRAFYMNRTIRRYLRRQVRAGVTAGGGLTYQNWMGAPTLMYGDTPIRRCDQLLNSETLVS